MKQFSNNSNKLKENSVYVTRNDCRLCGSRKLIKVWSFGKTPLANAYLKLSEAKRVKEPLVPLDVYQCQSCRLLQLRDVVEPKVLFQHYLYLSSTSASFRKHFEEYARTIKKRFKLKVDSLVVDVGSNDGILLKPFKEAGVKVLGIDPAKNVAKMATEEGIPTEAVFFTPEAARKIKRRSGAADVITANNVFAHTDDVIGFTEAAKELLKPEGAFVFEVQYLGDLIRKNLFDIVYHEHLCYYHLSPLVKFFAKQGMEVFDVERMAVHGGSLRVYVQHAKGPHKKEKRVDQLLASEKKQSLNTLQPYRAFAERLKENKLKLKEMLKKIKKAGGRIAGYGAPAKATTLLYTFGIGGETLEYIMDDDKKIKQGLLMPGSHIPIVPPEKMYEDKLEYCLILAWNFADAIKQNHAGFIKQGGRFIIPVPTPRIEK